MSDMPDDDKIDTSDIPEADEAFFKSARLRQRVAIPERMRHLKVDPRGYAVPFGVMHDANGVPHFAVNDEQERQRSIRDDLCSICGKKLFRGRWFVGGARSAFDPHGAYIDMPMHDECAHYALQVCPYLAAPRYSGEIGPKKWDAAPKTGTFINVDPTMIPGRPPLFVAVMAIGQRMVDGSAVQNYVVPTRPYRRIEFWQHGVELPPSDGYALAAEATGFSQIDLMRSVGKVVRS